MKKKKFNLNTITIDFINDFMGYDIIKRGYGMSKSVKANATIELSNQLSESLPEINICNLTE